MKDRSSACPVAVALVVGACAGGSGSTSRPSTAASTVPSTRLQRRRRRLPRWPPSRWHLPAPEPSMAPHSMGPESPALRMAGTALPSTALLRRFAPTSTTSSVSIRSCLQGNRRRLGGRTEQFEHTALCSTPTAQTWVRQSAASTAMRPRTSGTASGAPTTASSSTTRPVSRPKDKAMQDKAV